MLKALVRPGPNYLKTLLLIWEDDWRALQLQVSGRYEKIWRKLGGEGCRVHRGGRLVRRWARRMTLRNLTAPLC